MGAAEVLTPRQSSATTAHVRGPWRIHIRAGGNLKEMILGGGAIPLLVQMAAVPDGPPSEKDIAAAAQSLREGRLVGPSGMQAEHLRCGSERPHRRRIRTGPDDKYW